MASLWVHDSLESELHGKGTGKSGPDIMKVDLLDSRFGIVVPFLSMRSFLLECGCATFHSEVKRLVLSACHWCRPKYWPLAECPGLRWPQCVGGSPTRVSSPVSAFGLSALRIMTVPVFGLSALRIRCTVFDPASASCSELTALRIRCAVCDSASGLRPLGSPHHVHSV